MLAQSSKNATLSARAPGVSHRLAVAKAPLPIGQVKTRDRPPPEVVFYGITLLSVFVPLVCFFGVGKEGVSLFALMTIVADVDCWCWLVLRGRATTTPTSEVSCLGVGSVGVGASTQRW